MRPQVPRPLSPVAADRIEGLRVVAARDLMHAPRPIDITLLGQRVLVRRRTLKLSQKALAERGGVPSQVISELERDHQDIYSAQLARLAKALGVSADYLLGFTDERAMSKSKGAEEQTHGR